MSNLAYRAMIFAREAHAGQRRRYTNNPYTDHLAEVAGIVATVDSRPETIATAWLHDVMEDCGVGVEDIYDPFGLPVAEGVQWLSDIEQGNRTQRKALSRDRLSRAPDWVKTIKCADLISNTSSIMDHDPEFAKVYLEEKRALLMVITDADARLWELAWKMLPAT